MEPRWKRPDVCRWNLCKSVSFESPPPWGIKMSWFLAYQIKISLLKSCLIQKIPFFLRTLISISTFKYQFSSTNPHFEVAPVPLTNPASAWVAQVRGYDGIGFDAAVRHAGGTARLNGRWLLWFDFHRFFYRCWSMKLIRNPLISAVFLAEEIKLVSISPWVWFLHPVFMSSTRGHL